VGPLIFLEGVLGLTQFKFVKKLKLLFSMYS
jgi:hypothetical protein